jgi:hypothetical protein
MAELSLLPAVRGQRGRRDRRRRHLLPPPDPGPLGARGRAFHPRAGPRPVMNGRTSWTSGSATAATAIARSGSSATTPSTPRSARASASWSSRRAKASWMIGPTRRKVRWPCCSCSTSFRGTCSAARPRPSPATRTPWLARHGGDPRAHRPRHDPDERSFLYLPFEHAEAMAGSERVRRGLRGPARLPQSAEPGGTIDYAWRHRQVILRFGRFPHRNSILGRSNTPAEETYLSQPGSGF